MRRGRQQTLEIIEATTNDDDRGADGAKDHCLYGSLSLSLSRLRCRRSAALRRPTATEVSEFAVCHAPRLPSFLPSLLPSFLPSPPASFLPSFLPCFSSARNRAEFRARRARPRRLSSNTNEANRLPLLTCLSALLTAALRWHCQNS